MSDESKFLRDLREASIRTAVEHLRMIQRLKGDDESAVDEPLRRHPRRDDDEPAPRRDDEPARRRRDDGERDAWTSDLLFDAARLQLNTYNRLLDLSAKYTDRVIDGVRELLDPARRTPAARHHHRPLAVSGPAGEVAEATRAIAITNRLATPARVALSVSEFQRDGGGAPFSVAARFRSESHDRTLDPGETRAFWMALRLDPPFEAGERYHADVHVVMRGRLVETVGVEVEVERLRRF